MNYKRFLIKTKNMLVSHIFVMSKLLINSIFMFIQ